MEPECSLPVIRCKPCEKVIYKNYYNDLLLCCSSLAGILKLQCFLLKVCLLLGVRFHPQVTFESLLEPKSTSESGWKVKVSPSSCLVSGHTYDVIIAADGKKHCLPGFPVEVFRASLAISITANFVIHGTEEEAAAEEIAGLSSHFHPGFFKSLKKKHGIHLENIVYYRDKTHYFVMTAKKDSLLARGVIKQVISKQCIIDILKSTGAEFDDLQLQ